MNTQNVSIEQLAEKLGYTVWVKGDLKRIYCNDEGYNTKKMSSKTFIYEKDGEFMVSCHIECSSQPYQWVKSQEEEVKDSVYKRIERVIFEIKNPGIDYYEHLEKLRIKKENEEKLAALPQEEESWKRDYKRAKEMQKKHNNYESQSDEIKDKIKSILEEISAILGTPNSKARRAELDNELSNYILPCPFILEDGWIKTAVSFNSEDEYVAFKRNELLTQIGNDN